jgi:hypothetical protein
VGLLEYQRKGASAVLYRGNVPEIPLDIFNKIARISVISFIRKSDFGLQLLP